MRIANHEGRLAAITGEPGTASSPPCPYPEVCIPVIAVITYIC